MSGSDQARRCLPGAAVPANPDRASPRVGGARLGRLACAIVVSASLAACEVSADAPPSAAAIETFIGAGLPPGMRDLRADEEAGIDRLMRVRFDAPSGEVDAFAARLVTGGLMPDVDAGLIPMGGDLDWWLDALPPGAAGGRTSADEANRSYGLVSAPTQAGWHRVWLVAFTR